MRYSLIEPIKVRGKQDVSVSTLIHLVSRYIHRENKPMTAVPKTTKGRKTREQLIQAGQTVFARDRYVDARMSDVADEAGVSLGALYRYFGNKEELFVQVIADIHEDLFNASTSSHDLASEPLTALTEANRGYLDLYRQNRLVMKAFIQAAHVEDRFRDIWWNMRRRHVDRFVQALKSAHGMTDVNGVRTDVLAEAAACMTEHSAYVWFSDPADETDLIDQDEAVEAVSHSWHAMFFH